MTIFNSYFDITRGYNPWLIIGQVQLFVFPGCGRCMSFWSAWYWSRISLKRIAAACFKGWEHAVTRNGYPAVIKQCNGRFPISFDDFSVDPPCRGSPSQEWLDEAAVGLEKGKKAIVAPTSPAGSKTSKTGREVTVGCWQWLTRKHPHESGQKLVVYLPDGQTHPYISEVVQILGISGWLNHPFFWAWLKSSLATSPEKSCLNPGHIRHIPMMDLC